MRDSVKGPIISHLHTYFALGNEPDASSSLREFQTDFVMSGGFCLFGDHHSRASDRTGDQEWEGVGRALSAA